VDKVIQASEANRQFSRILREVREGDTYTITAHGRPIARIVPAVAKGSEAARQRLLERLRNQPTMEIGPFKREELYDC
jgi:prevent-host-death family protein